MRLESHGVHLFTILLNPIIRAVWDELTQLEKLGRMTFTVTNSVTKNLITVLYAENI